MRESESRGKVERDGGREREKEKPERVGVLGMSREISPPFLLLQLFLFPNKYYYDYYLSKPKYPQ